MILYLDSSALVKMYVNEEHSHSVHLQVREADQVATSRLAYPQARSALSRREREGGLTAAGHRRAVESLDRQMAAFVVVELHASVARLAGDLAAPRRLRGAG